MADQWPVSHASSYGVQTVPFVALSFSFDYRGFLSVRHRVILSERGFTWGRQIDTGGQGGYSRVRRGGVSDRNRRLFPCPVFPLGFRGHRLYLASGRRLGRAIHHMRETLATHNLFALAVPSPAVRVGDWFRAPFTLPSGVHWTFHSHPDRTHVIPSEPFPRDYLHVAQRGVQTPYNACELRQPTDKSTHIRRTT